METDETQDKDFKNKADEFKKKYKGIDNEAKAQIKDITAKLRDSQKNKGTGMGQLVREGNPFPMIKRMLSSAVAIGKGLSSVKGVKKAVIINKKQARGEFVSGFSGNKGQSQEQGPKMGPKMGGMG